MGQGWADKVEHLAKVLFDHMRYVYDIHEYGWPKWASECDKADYRKLAVWHMNALKAANRKVVRVVKRMVPALGNTEDYILGYADAQKDILAALTKGRGKGGER